MIGRNEKHAQLIQLIKDKLKEELQSQFIFANHHYRIASYQLMNIIYQEIDHALQENLLTPTQLDIISQSQDLAPLANAIAGSLNKDVHGFDIVRGRGLAPTGLCKIYYDDLNVRVRTFINDLTINTKTLDDIAASDNFEAGPTVYPASKDELHRSAEKRRRPIQLAFCLALLPGATPDQVAQLQVETTTPKTYGILTQLCAHQNVLRKFQPNPGDTDSIGAYKIALNEINNIRQAQEKKIEGPK